MPGSLPAIPFADATDRQAAVPGQGDPMPATSSVSRAVKETRADLELLQGAWISVSGRHQAEFLIAGNLFAIKFLNGKIYMGTLDLDAGERPKEMLMRIDEGPLRHKGKFALRSEEHTSELQSLTNLVCRLLL